MQDRQVSSTVVLAWLGWALGATFIVADFFVRSDDLGHLGIAVVGAGAVFHVRGMLCQHGIALREAFDLGRETGREEARIPLQRV